MELPMGPQGVSFSKGFYPRVFPTLEVSDHHEAHEGTGGYPVGVARVKSQATYVEKILTLVN